MAGMLAIANVGRAAAFRSGYFLRNVVPVWINGAARSGVIQQSIRIDLNTGEEPHRCSFEMKGGSGFVPRPGHDVTIGHGTTDNALFSGRILKATRVVMRHAETRPTYRCEAAGWLFDLNTTRIQKAFYGRSLSAASTVLGLLGVTTPSASAYGFSAVIDATLPGIDTFTAGPDEQMSEVFGRLFRQVDAHWQVDHKKRIRAFGSIDPVSGADVATLTPSNSMFWGLSYDATDLSRVYNVVVVRGATQPIEMDIDTTYHASMPLASASLLGNYITDAGTAGKFLNSDADFRIGAEVRLGDDGMQTPESHFRAGQVSLLFPASVNANTLVVVSANVSSIAPLRDSRWYNITGQYVYVASTAGVYALTASSVAYYYYVPSSISGAVLSDLNGDEPVTGVWNYVFDETIVTPFFPAGTEVQVYATTTGDTAVSSLFGANSFRNVARIIEDRRLGVAGALAVRDEALTRGFADAWRSISFETRDPNVEIGRTVYTALTSPGEASGPSIASSFTVQDVSIGDFGRLTETRGPVRSVRAGTVRRPTLWQVLQGDE